MLSDWEARDLAKLCTICGQAADSVPSAKAPDAQPRRTDDDGRGGKDAATDRADEDEDEDEDEEDEEEEEEEEEDSESFTR